MNIQQFFTDYILAITDSPIYSNNKILFCPICKKPLSNKNDYCKIFKEYDTFTCNTYNGDGTKHYSVYNLIDNTWSVHQIVSFNDITYNLSISKNTYPPWNGDILFYVFSYDPFPVYTTYFKCDSSFQNAEYNIRKYFNKINKLKAFQ